VFRHLSIPARPPEFDGLVVVCNVPSNATADLRALLASDGRCLVDLRSENTGHVTACFSTQIEAETCVAQLQDVLSKQFVGAFICLGYNDTPYLNRGWCVFETAVSTECITQGSRLHGWYLDIDDLPEKLIEIGPQDTCAMLPSDIATTRRGFMEHERPTREESIEQSIRLAHFTGAGDVHTVTTMYLNFVSKLEAAFALVSTKIPNAPAAPANGKKVWTELESSTPRFGPLAMVNERTLGC